MTMKDIVRAQVLQDFEIYWAEAREHEDTSPDQDDSILERRVDFYRYMMQVMTGDE